jgi:hypothetical protein
MFTVRSSGSDAAIEASVFGTNTKSASTDPFTPGVCSVPQNRKVASGNNVAR